MGGISLLAALVVLNQWMALPAAFAEISPPATKAEKKCTYSTWTWNSKTRSSQNHRRVEKPYAKLTSAERDVRSGCTVCEQDQELIKIEGVPPFRICKKFAASIRATLTVIVNNDFPIESVKGYAVGKSRGPTTPEGLHTKFSEHSFGTAIDINPKHNGLYANCKSFGPQCRLRRGGPRRLGNKKTIKDDSLPVQAFREMGWKWGGNRPGTLKNYMHFSLEGAI